MPPLRPFTRRRRLLPSGPPTLVLRSAQGRTRYFPGRGTSPLVALEMADGPDSPFGMKGPEGALIPSAPRSASEENVSEDHRKLLDELGFVGFAAERAALREDSDSEFVRATGSPSARMDDQLFMETVEMAWGLNRTAAQACFTAGDLDRSGRINQEEYLLLREAFVHKTPHDEHPAIRRLRISAIYHKYNKDADGKLTPNELLEWLRGESAVQRRRSVCRYQSVSPGRGPRRAERVCRAPCTATHTGDATPSQTSAPATTTCSASAQTCLARAGMRACSGPTSQRTRRIRQAARAIP